MLTDKERKVTAERIRKYKGDGFKWGTGPLANRRLREVIGYPPETLREFG